MRLRRVLVISGALVFAVLLSTTAHAQKLGDSAPGEGTLQPFMMESWVPEKLAKETADGTPGRETQAVVNEQATDRMRWIAAAYLHVVDINATNTVGDVEIPVEVGFGDLFSKIELPFSLHLEGMKGQWGFAVDYMYIRVGDEGVVETPLPGEVTAGGNFITSSLELFGTYRFGQPDEGNGSLDLIYGARWKRLALNLEITGIPPLQGGGFDKSWWDFMLGGRWVKKVHHRVGLLARVDLGADLWQVIGGVGFNVWRKLDLLVSYRHIDVSHSQGEGADYFAYEGTESGPLFGFGLHF